MKFNNLWVEKYRPQSLDDLLISSETKDLLLTFKNNKEIPHMLFSSGPGTGKTTTAKIIAKDLLKCDYLYINASEENGIDTIRNKVITFSETNSFDGGIKIIILDEVDGLTKPAQEALRGSMEYYYDTTRYILTANYTSKLIEPLLSRIQKFSILYDKKDVVRRCIKILKDENVIFDKGNIEKLVQMAYTFYPDVRRTINYLQKFSYNGVLSIENEFCSEELMDHITSELKNDRSLQLRAYLIENQSLFGSDYNNLLKSLLDYIYKSDITLQIKQELILILGEFLYRMHSISDKEIMFFVCTVQISKLLRR